MTQFVFLVESACLLILLSSLAFSFASRLSSKTTRWTISLFVILLPVIGFATCLWFLPIRVYRQLRSAIWLMLFVVIVVNVIVAWFANRQDRETSKPIASHWNLWPLAICAMAMVAMMLITFQTMDNQVKGRLAELRNVSQSIGTSVAPLKIPDRANAALIYRQANLLAGDIHSLTGRMKKLKRWLFELDTGESIEITSEFSEAIEEFDDIIRLLHRTSNCSGCYVIRDFERPNWSDVVPELDWSIAFAQLLHFSCLNSVAAENWEHAIADIEAMFRLAEHDLSEPFLFAITRSEIIDSKYAVPALKHLLQTPKFPIELLSRLNIQTGTYPHALQRGLLFEEAMYLSMISDLSTSDSWGEYFDQLGLEVDIAVPLPIYRTLYAVKDINLIRGMIGGFSRYANMPFYNCGENLRDIETAFRDELHFFEFVPELKSFWGEVFYPGIFKATHKGVALRKMSLIAITIRKYQSEHRQPPANLKDIWPDLTTDIQDPFSGKDLIYRVNDEGWILYSVGPNMTDDSGEPFDSENIKGDLVWQGK